MQQVGVFNRLLGRSLCNAHKLCAEAVLAQCNRSRGLGSKAAGDEAASRGTSSELRLPKCALSQYSALFLQ
jgi:hypothetical protein